MPISPVDTTWQDGGTQVRTQLPLRLCWAKRHIGSISPVVPLAITRTNGPWAHTFDDSYIYLSAVARFSGYIVSLFYFSFHYYIIIVAGFGIHREYEGSSSDLIDIM